MNIEGVGLGCWLGHDEDVAWRRALWSTSGWDRLHSTQPHSNVFAVDARARASLGQECCVWQLHHMLVSRFHVRMWLGG